MGLASAVRTPFVQRLAVGAAFASAGGFYSQYKSNLPCLQGILELDRREQSEPSPLATQTRLILRDGGAAAIRSLQQQQFDNTQQTAGRPAAPEDPTEYRPKRFGSHGARPSEYDLGAHTASAAAEAERPAPPPREPFPAPGAPGAGDSWEAVRQRYNARTAGDDPNAARAAHEALKTPSIAPEGPAAGGSRPRRVVRNQYGDEIVVE